MTLMLRSVAFFEVCCFLTVSTCTRGLLEICMIIAPKWGVPNGNHMNDDVVEVNGSDPPVLPGSFLHEKEPGYEARQWAGSPLLADWE